jgi:hypothetical protein
MIKNIKEAISYIFENIFSFVNKGSSSGLYAVVNRDVAMLNTNQNFFVVFLFLHSSALSQRRLS